MVFQAQRNNSVNAGYSCQDQLLNISLNRYTNENNANPRTRVNFLIRDTGAGYTNFAMNGNGVFQLPNTGSAGIAFPAYGDGANVSSNTLDDYEEGTWTPEARDNFSAGNQGTFSLAIGTYTKIGNKVTLWGRFSNVDTSGMNPSFDFCVAGLPFAANSALTFVTGTIGTNFITFSGQIAPRIEGARSSFRILETMSASNNDYVTVSQVNSGTADAFFTLIYYI